MWSYKPSCSFFSKSKPRIAFPPKSDLAAKVVKNEEGEKSQDVTLEMMAIGMVVLMAITCGGVLILALIS